MKSKIINAITLSCCFLSGIFFCFACFFLIKNSDFESANHSFLFGTSSERFILGNSVTLVLVGSLPLLVPLILKRNLLNVILAMCSIGLFFLLKWVVFVISD